MEINVIDMQILHGQTDLEWKDAVGSHDHVEDVVACVSTL